MKTKKTPETIKEELLASILEVFEEGDYLQICQEVKNAKEGELLKRLKDSDEFFDGVGFSRSNVYFKIRLYKFLCKFPALRNSTLTSSYFKNNFKILKKFARQKQTYLVRKSKKHLFYYFLSSLSLFG